MPIPRTSRCAASFFEIHAKPLLLALLLLLQFLSANPALSFYF